MAKEGEKEGREEVKEGGRERRTEGGRGDERACVRASERVLGSHMVSRPLCLGHFLPAKCTELYLHTLPIIPFPFHLEFIIRPLSIPEPCVYIFDYTCPHYIHRDELEKKFLSGMFDVFCFMCFVILFSPFSSYQQVHQI